MKSLDDGKNILKKFTSSGKGVVATGCIFSHVTRIQLLTLTVISYWYRISLCPRSNVRPPEDQFK